MGYAERFFYTLALLYFISLNVLLCWCMQYYILPQPRTLNNLQGVDWVEAEKSLEVDQTVKPVDWATPGTRAGLDLLNEFCLKRLRKFADSRNDPTLNALSNLSPWIHFG